METLLALSWPVRLVALAALFFGMAAAFTGLGFAIERLFGQRRISGSGVMTNANWSAGPAFGSDHLSGIKRYCGGLLYDSVLRVDGPVCAKLR